MSLRVHYALAIFLLGCLNKVCAGTPTSIEVRLDDGNLRIPSEYLLPALPPTIVPNTHLDKGKGISLRIPYNHLGLKKSSQNNLKNNLIILISSVSDFFSQQGMSIDAYNAWQGRELYQDRVIEYDEDKKLYLIGSQADYPMFWHYYSYHPEEKNRVDNPWVASCYEAVKAMSTCSARVASKGIESKLGIPGEYVTELPRIISAYQQLLNTWYTSENAD
jgi:hypothetical protein